MKLFTRATAAVALAGAALVATSAQAATTYTCGEVGSICDFDGTTGGFLNNKVAAGQSSNDIFKITLDTAGTVSLSFTTNKLTFGAFTFAGQTFTPISGQPYAFKVGAGTYSLTTNVSNTTDRVSSYSNTIDFQPVPEPASWGMMIGGFALGGAALRRRNGKAFAAA